jgi:aminopeptidase N
MDSAYWAVSGVPSELTYSTKTVYEKGADRVHTLRFYMGDSVFFSCVKSYLQQYKFKDVNSDKMRDYIVSCSGNTAINNFFADWIHTGGFPDFSINEKTVNKVTDKDYEVTINIQQRINHSPTYFNHVPLEVFYFDSFGNATKRQADVSGGCTSFKTHLGFSPAYIALDFDEKISDAITDEWVWTKNAFSYNFNTAKMIVYPKNQTDSSLVRVEHHWVAPDANKNHLKDIHLSDYRYWNVDGIFTSNFYADARVFYNGSTTPIGYLDNTLISSSVNDLVLLYRPNPQSDWTEVDSAKNFVSNPTGKSGYFDIYGLKKGEYALAINDPDKVDSIQQISSCFPLSIPENIESKMGFNLYPNPMHEEELNVELGAVNYFSKCVVVDMLGNTVADRNLKENQSSFILYMNGLHRGVYIVTLFDKFGGKTSKQVVKAK